METTIIMGYTGNTAPLCIVAHPQAGPAGNVGSSPCAGLSGSRIASVGGDCRPVAICLMPTWSVNVILRYICSPSAEEIRDELKVMNQKPGCRAVC